MNGVGGSITRALQLGSRYPRQVARVRIGVGIWLFFVAMMLYSSGYGGGWTWLLVATAALHFCLAYRLFRIARNDSERRASFQ